MTRSLSALRVPVLLLAGTLFAGCSALKNNAEPERLYVLRAAPAAATPALAAVVSVPRPLVHPGLDSPRLALTRPGNELDYYAASRWGGSLPEVLGAFAVHSLDGSFATVVGGERSAGPADFELLLTARHFEAEYESQDAAPVVRVTLECLLVDTSPRRVVGGCDADVREPASENRMASIVGAFERAAQRALQEVRDKATAAAAAAQAAGATAPGGAVPPGASPVRAR